MLTYNANVQLHDLIQGKTALRYLKIFYLHLDMRKHTFYQSFIYLHLENC